LSAHEAQQQALTRIYAGIQAQAAALAYVDTFWLLGIAALIMFVLSFVLKKNDPRGGRRNISAH
jgi:DHA2 family multidrug resistance protein